MSTSVFLVVLDIPCRGKELGTCFAVLKELPVWLEHQNLTTSWTDRRSPHHIPYWTQFYLSTSFFFIKQDTQSWQWNLYHWVATTASSTPYRHQRLKSDSSFPANQHQSLQAFQPVLCARIIPYSQQRRLFSFTNSLFSKASSQSSFIIERSPLTSAFSTDVVATCCAWKLLTSVTDCIIFHSRTAWYGHIGFLLTTLVTIDETDIQLGMLLSSGIFDVVPIQRFRHGERMNILLWSDFAWYSGTVSGHSTADCEMSLPCISKEQAHRFLNMRSANLHRQTCFSSFDEPVYLCIAKQQPRHSHEKLRLPHSGNP